MDTRVLGRIQKRRANNQTIIIEGIKMEREILNEIYDLLIFLQVEPNEQNIEKVLDRFKDEMHDYIEDLIKRMKSWGELREFEGVPLELSNWNTKTVKQQIINSILRKKE